MREITGLAGVFWWTSKLSIQKSMQYRVNFLLGLLIDLGFSSMGPIVQYLIFSQTRGFPGWNLRQIILFQGILLFWLGLKDLLFGGTGQLVGELVWKGDFDRLLVKPYSPIGIILASGFRLDSIGTLAAGAVIIVYSMRAMALSVSLAQLGLIMLCLICGLLFAMALIILISGIVIMVIQINRLGEILDNFLQFANYPLEIYGKATRAIFITGMPIMIWAYLPAQVLLHRVRGIYFLCCLGCLAFFGLSLLIWRSCLRKYTSAGG